MGAVKNWVPITSSRDGTKLVAGLYGGNIWTSTDSGTTWSENTSTGAGKRCYSITSSSDDTKLATVVRYGNIWRSTDSGASWIKDTSVVGNQGMRWLESIHVEQRRH